jgi:hypothetical protein
VKRIRTHLSYANVMSTIAVFLVLGGGAAIAAKQLVPKKSVGTKQLKPNAVTTAKIKKNAVTKAKIKAGAVDGTKIADGSIKQSEVDVASMPFSQIVHQARGGVTVPLSGGYPLGGYTQPAGRTDTYVGVLDVTFEPGCEPPRTITAYLSVDPSNPAAPPSEADIAGVGIVQDEAGGTVTKRINIGPYINSVQFKPATAVNHTLSLYGGVSCKSGSGAHATAAAIDVIGIR